MINISHPKIHGKPPVNRPFPAKDQHASTKQHGIAVESTIPKNGYIDNNAAEAETADYNQNIIESTTCSFEQLCSMISDLEKNITSGMPELDQLQVRGRTYSRVCRTEERNLPLCLSTIATAGERRLEREAWTEWRDDLRRHNVLLSKTRRGYLAAVLLVY